MSEPCLPYPARLVKRGEGPPGTIDELFAKDGVELQPDEVYFRCEDGETTIKKR